MFPRISVTLTVLSILLTFEISQAAKPSTDWPQWRGPNRDGIANETGLLQDWKEQKPELLWTAEGIGKGFASISVANGQIFTMGDKGSDQFVFALTLDGGEMLWETKVGTAGGIGYPGSRCTPTVDGEMVYVLGTKGDLACLKAANGEIVWKRNLAEDFGGKMMSGWGFSESPLVDGDKLVCTPGGADAGMVALNKLTGKEIWRSKIPMGTGNGQDGAGYSSIVVSEGANTRQYVQLVGRGCIGVSAKDGKLLWEYNRIANPTANIPTPVVSGDHVFCSSGYGTGAALLKLEKKRGAVSASEVYFLPANKMQNHHGGMILYDGHIYCGSGHNKGFPICVEMLTGKISWFAGRGPGEGSAAVAFADGHFYFRYQDGLMALIEASPEKYIEKGTFKIPGVKDPSWPHPVIADGKLYLREQNRLHCYDIKR